MGWFARRRWQDEVQDRVAHQLSELRRDVSTLGTSVARYGGHLRDDASDIGGALRHGGEAMARQLGKQATRAGRALREDPMPAVIGVVAIVGVVAALSLAFGRR